MICRATPHDTGVLLTEHQLQRARRSMWRQLTFIESLESAYRGSQDRRYRIPRTILFGVAAISFLIAPISNQWIFLPDDEIRPTLLFIQWVWAFPVLAATAVVQWLGLSRTALYGFNVAGTLTLWASCGAQHILSELGQMQYPLHVVNFTVMAVAIFCGFRPRLIILGGTITIAASLAAVLIADGTSGYPNELFIYESVYYWLIGVGGTITIDLLNREAWLNRKHIHLLARTDALSGLLTRGAFNERYAGVIAMAYREKRYVAVALIDLDHFKTFNDRYGHLKGDEVLTATGKALLQVEGGGRPMDVRARYGGEEFVVVWYDVQPHDLELMGQRVLAAIRELDIRTQTHGERIPITASIGIVSAVPQRTGGDALLKAADEQLYAAKTGGRNRTHVAVLSADGGLVDQRIVT